MADEKFEKSEGSRGDDRSRDRRPVRSNKTSAEHQRDYILIIIGLIVIAAIVYVVFPQNRQNAKIDNTVGATSKDVSVKTPESSAPKPTEKPPITTMNPKNFSHTVTIETNKGTIVFETYDADAPKTSQNFVTLASKDFYNGVIFHRVIKGFMIQGGDPTGTGRGGPGYQFEDELNPKTESYAKGYVRGVVAMANSGPDTNGSQFFIMHQDYPLPNNYTIFGRVVKGIEVVDAIANSKTDAVDKPLEQVVMKKVTVTEKN